MTMFMFRDKRHLGCIVPADVILDSRLSLSDIGIYAYIALRESVSDLDYLAGEISDRFQMSISDVNAGINRLVQAGYLSVEG